MRQEIQNLLENSYVTYKTPKHVLGNQQSLISRQGDVNKNIHLLADALTQCKYPNNYSIDAWKAGHPTEFLKILHFALFHLSQHVYQHLMANGVDQDTLVLPDNQFMARVLFIMPQFFSYRPAISIEQFFKYGYAEQKMILCIDVINLVRRKARSLT
jgi:hypothetical protein